MSEEEEAYCRLCAELTTKETLISPDEDVGINSKIKTKMLWINIDITTSDLLPKSICFSCFDALERTWSFLHNVRTAQTKLQELFVKQADNKDNNTDTKIEINIDQDGLNGKPMNVDWEEWEKQDVKPDINALQVVTVDPNSLLNLETNIKIERGSPDKQNLKVSMCHEIDVKINHDDDDGIRDDADDFLNTTDSDVPLYMTVKKLKLKKKKRKETKIRTKESDQSPLTWDEYMCRCAICDAQCMNITSLRLHSVQIHGCCCTFKCSECSKVVSNFKSFINHVRLHVKSLRFCCEFCSKQFKMASDLNKHKYNKHNKEYLTMCQNCGATFETEEQLQDHTIIFESKTYRKRAPKCKKNDSILKCEHCHKEFKSRSNLKQHQLVHTDRQRNFACHVCGKMFFTNGTLWTHIMTHDDKKQFKCDFCGLAFRARGNLTAHISLHSGVKPFVCEQCGKSFRSKRHLKSHSIVHTDLMPYTCEYCNKNFRFKTRLNLHLRQHTGAKPYRCEFCMRDFTNGSNFKKHMKRRHNIDTSSRKHYNNAVANQPRTMEGSDGEKNPA